MTDPRTIAAHEDLLQWREQRSLLRDHYQRRQDGICAICEQPPPPGKTLHLDHDHATGQPRGLLCMPCNTALGLFRDDIERLERAIAYLLKPQRHRTHREMSVLLAQPPTTQETP